MPTDLPADRARRMASPGFSSRFNDGFSSRFNDGFSSRFNDGFSSRLNDGCGGRDAESVCCRADRVGLGLLVLRGMNEAYALNETNARLNFKESRRITARLACTRCRATLRLRAWFRSEFRARFRRVVVDRSRRGDGLLWCRVLRGLARLLVLRGLRGLARLRGLRVCGGLHRSRR